MVNHGTVRVLRRAAEAFDRGDRYMQVQQPLWLDHATTVLGTCDGAGRVERGGDLLGALADIGWELEHVSYVPVDTGASRPRATPDGLGATVMGIYLLRADRRPRPAPRPDGLAVRGCG